MALWSVYPFANASVWYAGGHPELRAWLELPGGRRLRIDVLHTDAPYEGSGEPVLWDQEIGAVRQELAREPRPLVAVGDLNATWYDWHFQAILALGLRDAAVVAGQGWRMTWPRDQQPVVPYLRIDHVLLSNGVSLESYGLGTGKGQRPPSAPSGARCEALRVPWHDLSPSTQECSAVLAIWPQWPLCAQRRAQAGSWHLEHCGDHRLSVAPV